MEMEDSTKRMTEDESPVTFIGCCGAYCRPCRPFREGVCRGCKLGYQNGRRNLSGAKCRMKVCSLSRGFQTCADCPEFSECEVINNFFNKTGYKYRKYREAIEFIRAYGYEAFLAQADDWTGACGRLSAPRS